MAAHELDTERFRARLLQLCSKLEASREAGSGATATVELDQQRQGRLSRMDALGAQQISAATQRRREEMLVRVRRAIKRMDSGEYGWCVICDEPIDPRRLEVDPPIETCIRCAERAERD